MTTATAPHALTLQMLAWLGGGPRTYGETMDAWRTSCPRLSIWEDALADQLIRVARVNAGGGAASSVVELTAQGRAMLAQFERISSQAV